MHPPKIPILALQGCVTVVATNLISWGVATTATLPSTTSIMGPICRLNRERSGAISILCNKSSRRLGELVVQSCQHRWTGVHWDNHIVVRWSHIPLWLERRPSHDIMDKEYGTDKDYVCIIRVVYQLRLTARLWWNPISARTAPNWENSKIESEKSNQYALWFGDKRNLSYSIIIFN